MSNFAFDDDKYYAKLIMMRKLFNKAFSKMTHYNSTGYLLTKQSP